MSQTVPDPYKTLEPSKDLVWYIPNFEKKITPEIRHLLETYSEIPSDKVVQHVHNIRDKAWAIRPYPCTGLGNFLFPMITHCPVYTKIISWLQAGDSLLDVGCYLGQDLRRLVFDGAPSTNLYAVDIVSHWDLGYALFNDKSKFSAKFIEGDILNPHAELSALQGKIGIVWTSHVLHQWVWEGQVEAAIQLSKFSKAGGMVAGCQVGTTDEGGKVVKVKGANNEWFKHDKASFEKMWDVVSERTQTKWDIEVVMRRWEEVGFDVDETAYLGEDARVLFFVATRLV